MGRRDADCGFWRGNDDLRAKTERMRMGGMQSIVIGRYSRELIPEGAFWRVNAKNDVSAQYEAHCQQS